MTILDPIDLSIDEETGDIATPVLMNVGLDSVVQGLRIRLSMIRGEWFANTAFGLPYLARPAETISPFGPGSLGVPESEAILGSKPNPGRVRRQLRNFILATPGVNEILQLDVTFQRAIRRLDISFQVNTTFGISDIISIGVPGNINPVSGFSFITNNLQVTFRNESFDIDGTIDSFLWNFGDGNTSTVQDPIHTYANTTGSPYTVTLTVTDNQGGQGFSSQPVTVSTTVPTDGPDNVFVPNSADDFNTLNLTPPDSLWLCQEASGNLADSIGLLSLVASNAPGYQATVTGWTRVAVTTADASTQAFTAAAASGPDPSAVSQLWLGYIDLTLTPAAQRITWGPHGAVGGESADCRLTTVPNLRATCVGTNADGTADPVTGGVRPIVVLYDRTNSRFAVFSDQEKIIGTFNVGVTDGHKGLGNTLNATDTAMVWACLYTGIDAELSDAQIKTLLQGLGWTIPWS